MMDQAGLIVAGNDIAFMHRSYARTPDTWENAPDYYVQFYREHFPCSTLLYSSDQRMEAVMNLVLEKQVRGFIFAGEKFCEYEYFECIHICDTLKQKIQDRLSEQVKTYIEQNGYKPNLLFSEFQNFSCYY